MENLELDDQEAIRWKNPEMAVVMNRISARNGLVNTRDGCGMKPQRARLNTMREIGLRMKIDTLTFDGGRDDLLMSLIASLNGWRSPMKPTLWGPCRMWIEDSV